VEELEAIADDDNADVPSLHGWRRQLFGDKAIALKNGQLGLAMNGRRVVVWPVRVAPRAASSEA
jgi:ribonuclease D